jgi:hypothetical protein
MPTRSGASAGFNPLASSRARQSSAQDGGVDEDGWGADAPQVTRTQLEKVQPAYKPTKVNMAELTKQKPETSRFSSSGGTDNANDSGDVVRGGYQPVGKVDIAAIRAQAQKPTDDRPTIVKGAYEPVGKVDIAAIRAKAQKPSDDSPRRVSPVVTATSTGSAGDDEPKSLAARSAAFSQSERLTTLPKPKIASKFGSSTNNFTGTKAPTPGVFGLQSAPPTSVPAPVGAASRTFADEGGKTPAQIWAEKKARERGFSGAAEGGNSNVPPPVTSQTSGGNEWKSGYAGKSWAPVATTATGRSGAGGVEEQRTGEQGHEDEETPSSPAGGVGALRDRFRGAAPMGAPTLHKSTTGDESPPPLDTSSKPTAGNAMPGLPSRGRPVGDDEDEEEEERGPPQPPRVQRSPTPDERDTSPVRIAMPVSRGKVPELEAPEERLEPPIMPVRSIQQNIPDEEDLTEEPAGHDPARGAAIAMAETSFGHDATDATSGGKRALVQYDYEKAEDNEIDLVEGEYVTDIVEEAEDWWSGKNSKGEIGLFPANYVEVVEDEEESAPPQPARHTAASVAPAAAPAPSNTHSAPKGPTATALYDYEAAEDNELSFAEGDKITELVRVYSSKQVLR